MSSVGESGGEPFQGERPPYNAACVSAERLAGYVAMDLRNQGTPFNAATVASEIGFVRPDPRHHPTDPEETERLKEFGWDALYDPDSVLHLLRQAWLLALISFPVTNASRQNEALVLLKSGEVAYLSTITTATGKRQSTTSPQIARLVNAASMATWREAGASGARSVEVIRRSLVGAISLYGIEHGAAKNIFLTDNSEKQEGS